MDYVIFMKIVYTLAYLPDDYFRKVFMNGLVLLQKIIELSRWAQL